MGIIVLTENEKNNILRQSFLFQGVSESVFEKAISDGGFYIKYYQPGETISEPEKFECSLGIILDGTAKIAAVGRARNVPLKTIGNGSIFGAASLFSNEDRYVSRITAKSAVKAAFMSQASVKEIITSDRRAALNYIKFLSDRIRFLNDKIASFTSGTAESRLARYIENLREEDGCVILPTGLRQLADSLDISRASLYRAFDTLESLGCIKRDGRKIAILSAELLKDVK